MRTFRINENSKLDMVKFRDTDDYEAKIENYANQNYILKFSASWCNPCKLLQKQLEELAPFLKERNIHVLHADVDKCKILCEQCNVGPIPTCFFFKSVNGGPSQQVATFVGLKDMKVELPKYYGDCPVVSSTPTFVPNMFEQKKNIFL